MRRREVIGLLSGAAVWPVAARAQRPEGVKHIAVLMGIAENDPEGQARVAAFRQGLRDLRWEEGRHVRIDIRWGAGDPVRIKDHAAELVGLAPDVILATNTPTIRALKQATETVPIVFTGLTDPIGEGVVANLSRPAGNITGFTSFNAEIAAKWLQLLKEVFSGTKRAAVMFNPTTAPHALFLPVIKEAAPQLDLMFLPVPVVDRTAIQTAIAELARAPGAGLVLLPDTFLAINRELIFALCTPSGLPTICPVRHFAASGGLMSYGPNFVDLHRQAASYVDRILRGARPHDLPVQDPTKYELVINLNTAKALGLTIPPSLLARADEVIE